MEIKLISQEHDTGCAIACIAMVTGKAYQEVNHMMKNPKWVERVGLSTELTLKLLVLNRIFPTINDTIKGGKVSIVAVPSLNMRGGMHYIVIDARESKYLVFDPNEGRERKDTYKNISEVKGYAEVIGVEYLEEKVA